jgi:AbrB family looped-hinge helix DNA binding protein
MDYDTVRVGKRGTVVIPAPLRKAFGVEEGAFIIAEARPEGILLRPAGVYPVEVYTVERKAEFLLNNAVSHEDYIRAADQVRQMGLDPATVPHRPPPETRRDG